jgi:hypothetical protein
MVCTYGKCSGRTVWYSYGWCTFGLAQTNIFDKLVVIAIVDFKLYFKCSLVRVSYTV